MGAVFANAPTEPTCVAVKTRREFNLRRGARDCLTPSDITTFRVSTSNFSHLETMAPFGSTIRRAALSRPQTPVNTAVEKGFYSFETPSGTDSEIERQLAKAESEAKPVLERLGHPGERLTEKDISILAYFIGVAHTRVPRSVEMVKEVISETAAQYVKLRATDRKWIQRYLEARKTGAPSTLNEEELAELASNFEKRFANPKFALLQSLSLAGKVAEFLLRMN